MNDMQLSPPSHEAEPKFTTTKLSAEPAHSEHDSQVELAVNTFEDLVWLKNALGDYILVHRSTGDVDDQKLSQAQALKDKMTDDITLLRTEETEVPPVFTYVIEEEGFIKDAVKTAKSRQQQDEQLLAPAPLPPTPEFEWLSNPDKTHPAAEKARFHNIDDRRLSQL